MHFVSTWSFEIHPISVFNMESIQVITAEIFDICDCMEKGSNSYCSYRSFSADYRLNASMNARHKLCIWLLYCAIGRRIYNTIIQLRLNKCRAETGFPIPSLILYDWVPISTSCMNWFVMGKSYIKWPKYGKPMCKEIAFCNALLYRAHEKKKSWNPSENNRKNRFGT